MNCNQIDIFFNLSHHREQVTKSEKWRRSKFNWTTQIEFILGREGGERSS